MDTAAKPANDDAHRDPNGGRHHSRGRNLRPLLVIGGSIVVVLLLSCGGLVAIVMHQVRGFQADLRAQLTEDPRLTEIVGDIREFSPHLVATGDREDGAIVFHVRGTKKQGNIVVASEKDREGKHHIVSAYLELPDGSTVELDPIDKP